MRNKFSSNDLLTTDNKFIVSKFKPGIYQFNFPNIEADADQPVCGKYKSVTSTCLKLIGGEFGNVTINDPSVLRDTECIYISFDTYDEMQSINDMISDIKVYDGSDDTKLKISIVKTFTEFIKDRVDDKKQFLEWLNCINNDDLKAIGIKLKTDNNKYLVL